MEPDRISRRDTALAAIVTVLALLPFIGKAFNIDDPMYLWAARRIVDHPLDPYGFLVHWYEQPLPMWQVNKNPPLTSYCLALAGRVMGWSEAALHLFFLVPAAAAVTGTYRLARRLSPRPLLAAMATLAAPVFLISSTGIMSDTLLLACWVWALFLWMKGLDQGKALPLFLAAFLVAAASLVKYFGMSLLPLVALYSVLRKGRPALWLPPLLVPLIVLAGYQAWTQRLYGLGLLLEPAGYAIRAAADIRSEGPAAWVRCLSGLVFTGGCVLPALLLAPFLWSRKTLLAMAVVALAVGLVSPIGWHRGPDAALADQWSVLVWVQAGLFAAGGIGVLGLAAADMRARRDPDALMLGLWVFGTFLFADVVNWELNGRSILPLVPAAAILLARRLGPPARPASQPDWRAWGPVVLSGAVAVVVASGDASFARSQREAAFTVRRMADAEGVANLWYEGHWGFQYYMDAVGGRPLDNTNIALTGGEWVVIPTYNTNQFDLPDRIVADPQVVSLETNALAATMMEPEGAGFYASHFGPLPYSLGPVSPDQFIIYRIRGVRGG